MTVRPVRLLVFLTILTIFPFRLHSKNCTSANCHGSLVSKRSVHSAVKQGGCTDCHDSPTGDHPFKLMATGESLCLNCHESPKKAGERIHPALEQGTCTDCHDPHSSDFKNNLKDKPPELCYGCHDRKDEGKFVHSAVLMGKCTSCHDPHSSINPFLIRGIIPPGSDSHQKLLPQKQVKDISLSGVCVQCHKDKAETRATRHPPFAQGKCLLCHNPHNSNFENLLVKPSSVLCRNCHDSINIVGKKTKLSQKVTKENKEIFYITSKKWNGSGNPDDNVYVHGAVKTGRCSVCHEPHQSDNQRLLRSSKISELCFQCHSNDLTGRKSVHPPAGEGDCTACHSPHGSSFQKNLIEEPPELCYSCHDKVDEGKTLHGALRVKGCTGCHNPHGSDYEPLLSVSINDICVKCHKDRNDGAHIFTGFTQQLHPVKGPKDPKREGKTLSCVSCHNPHSSDNPKLFYEGNTKEEMCRRCHKI